MGTVNWPPRLFPATTCVFFDALSFLPPLFAASSTLFFTAMVGVVNRLCWLYSFFTTMNFFFNALPNASLGQVFASGKDSQGVWYTAVKQSMKIS